MSSSWQSPGLKSVGEYQLSGHPFNIAERTADATVTLQRVSRAINITCDTASAVTIHFYDLNAAGAAKNTTFTLAVGMNRLEVRCRKFKIEGDGSAKYSVCVELTDIPASEEQPLTTYPALGTVA